MEGNAPRIALYAGSFDPLTIGHEELIQRGLRMFDKIVVGVAHNPDKKHMFSTEQRIFLIEESLRAAGYVRRKDDGRLDGRLDTSRVEVVAIDGLTVQAARSMHACALLRGVRGAADLEYETQMDIANKLLAPDIETFFLLPSAGKAFVSSRLVREVALLGGDVSALVSPTVLFALKQRHLAQGSL